MATISIITPTYNHAGFISECITSILGQTFQDWELIIIDDGSTDGTGDIIKTFQDTRIQYHFQPHKGITGLQDLYNDALAYAKGIFIAIIEGDDFWPPERLSILLGEMNDPEISVSFGITQLTDKNGIPLELTIPLQKDITLYENEFNNIPHGIIVKGMLLSNALWSGSVACLIRKEKLDEIGGFKSVEGGSLIDRPTFFELGLTGKFKFVNVVTGYWRRHGASGTNSILIWDIIAEGLYFFIKDFVNKNKRKLDLTNGEQTKVIVYWKNGMLSSNMASGRVCLLNGEFKRARGYFRTCIYSLKIILVVPALVGLLFSFLKLNIEPLYKMQGFKTFDV